MGLATHLGPQLTGTVKNTTGTLVGTYRNTGAGDAFQFGTLPFSQTALGPLNFTAPNTGFVQAVCIPAGSYINGITVDILTAFNGTNNTITFALGQTTASTTTIGTIVATAVTLAANSRIVMASGTPLTGTVVTMQNLAFWTNVSNGQTIPTDQFLYAFYTGTGSPSTGSAYISVDYCVRNPDTSYFPQNPSPNSNIVATF